MTSEPSSPDLVRDVAFLPLNSGDGKTKTRMPQVAKRFRHLAGLAVDGLVKIYEQVDGGPAGQAVCDDLRDNRKAAADRFLQTVACLIGLSRGEVNAHPARRHWYDNLPDRERPQAPPPHRPVHCCELREPPPDDGAAAGGPRCDDDYCAARTLTLSRQLWRRAEDADGVLKTHPVSGAEWTWYEEWMRGTVEGPRVSERKRARWSRATQICLYVCCAAPPGLTVYKEYWTLERGRRRIEFVPLKTPTRKALLGLLRGVATQRADDGVRRWAHANEVSKIPVVGGEIYDRFEERHLSGTDAEAFAFFSAISTYVEKCAVREAIQRHKNRNRQVPVDGVDLEGIVRDRQREALRELVRPGGDGVAGLSDAMEQLRETPGLLGLLHVWYNEVVDEKQKRSVESVLRDLPRAQRLSAAGYFFAGRRVNEIGFALGLARSAVSRNKMSAFDRLKEGAAEALRIVSERERPLLPQPDDEDLLKEDLLKIFRTQPGAVGRAFWSNGPAGIRPRVKPGTPEEWSTLLRLTLYASDKFFLRGSAPDTIVEDAEDAGGTDLDVPAVEERLDEAWEKVVREWVRARLPTLSNLPSAPV